MGRAGRSTSCRTRRDVTRPQLTGIAAIVPVSVSGELENPRLKSWDRVFKFPLPDFSRCEMIFEKPIYVPREATDAERERLRQQLEAELRAISEGLKRDK